MTEGAHTLIQPVLRHLNVERPRVFAIFAGRSQANCASNCCNVRKSDFAELPSVGANENQESGVMPYLDGGSADSVVVTSSIRETILLPSDMNGPPFLGRSLQLFTLSTNRIPAGVL
jgi:hypothetical protein